MDAGPDQHGNSETPSQHSYVRARGILGFGWIAARGINHQYCRRRSPEIAQPFLAHEAKLRAAACVAAES